MFDPTDVAPLNEIVEYLDDIIRQPALVRGRPGYTRDRVHSLRANITTRYPRCPVLHRIHQLMDGPVTDAHWSRWITEGVKKYGHNSL